MNIPPLIQLIAAPILQGLFGIGTSLVSGGLQRGILEEGQAESRMLSEKQIKESKRQFDLSYGLQKRKLDMTQETMARNDFRSQASRLTGILDKNESLMNLYINRLSGLRR